MPLKRTPIRYPAFLKAIMLLLLANIYLSAHAQENRDHAILITADSMTQGWTTSENWKFINADNIAYASADYNDSQWSSISSMLEGKAAKHFTGIGWFRYYFRFDSSMCMKPIYLFMHQNGASEIYLDGKLLSKVGIIRKSSKSLYKSSRSQPVFFTLNDTATHVLAVRYEYMRPGRSGIGSDHEGKGFSLSIALANKELSDIFSIYKRIGSIAMFISGAFLALGFLHLLLFVFYPKALYNLYFGLYNLSIGAIAYFVYVRLISDNPLWEERVNNYMFFAIVLFGMSMTGFVNTLFSRHPKRLYIVLGIGFIIMLLFWINIAIAALTIGFYFTYVVFEAFFVIIRAMIRREKSAFIVGGGILVFFLVVVMIIIAAIMNGGNLNLNEGVVLGQSIGVLLTIVLISFPMSISAYLAWQFAYTNLNLKKQLAEVQKLSAYSLQQEQEKKQLLEHQNEILEQEVKARTNELATEKKKSDDLLLNILPQEVADELKEKGESKAHYYDEVSVLFTDFVNFTAISEKLGVEALLQELNINFTAFDRIMEKHGLEKIKTIGDAYLAVSGLPNKNERHAQQAVLAALDILNFVEKRKKEVPYGLDIRIGINSGSLVAGIVGVKKFAYDIWGDTVNTAARMEQNSEPGKINISIHSYELVKEDFICIYRGKIKVKGKGEMDMYFVENDSHKDLQLQH